MWCRTTPSSCTLRYQSPKQGEEKTTTPPLQKGGRKTTPPLEGREKNIRSSPCQGGGWEGVALALKAKELSPKA